VLADLAARLSALGPYFAVTAGVDGPRWRPLTELPAALPERVAHVRSELERRAGAAVEYRVAASIHHLGFASRLVAPALGAVALDGVVPSWVGVHWQPVDGGPVPVAVVDVTVGPAAAGAYASAVLVPLVAPVVDAFAALGVSRTVLWGNVASALAGATGMLLRSGRDLAVDPVAFVTELLARPGPLRAAGRFGIDERFFRRESCCLFYRVPHAGKCGDCILL
jgi:ferric iron reductase protein FhuF